jgi:hypothetical protein
MKKIFLGLYVLFCACTTGAQNPLEPVLKNYFRTHPLNMRFSSFITSLQQDPWFTVEEYSRRTDTSFFYLTGIYKNFNPFHYPAKEVRLIVSETEFIHTDSLKTLDTIIIIQLMGITDSSFSNQSFVKTEFSRFQKKYSAGFWNSNYNKMERGNTIIAEVNNYFIFPFSISPVAAAWGKITETGTYTFTITLRLKVKENIADLIVSPE